MSSFLIKTTYMTKQKKTQVIGARIPYDKYNLLEVKCLEQRIPMSKVIQSAVAHYLEKNIPLNSRANDNPT